MAYNRTLQHFTNTDTPIPLWASSQAYNVNDLVIYNDAIYRCLVAHTSSGSFATDLAAGYWVAISGGGGTSTLNLTAGENLLAGDAVYISEGAVDSARTAGRIYKLDVTNNRRYNAIGFTTGAVSSGSTVDVQINGELTGLSGLSTGSPVYGSTTVPGGVQTAIPFTLNEWVVELGIATSATTLLLNPAAFGTAYQIGANNWHTDTQASISAGQYVLIDPLKPLQKIIVAAATQGITALSVTPFGTTAYPNGTLVNLIGGDTLFAISLSNNDASKGAILNGDCILYQYDSITLQYDSLFDRWIEISRNS